MTFVVIFGCESALRMQGARTKRSLFLHGIDPRNIHSWDCNASLSDLAHLLKTSQDPIWFVQAGAWLSPQFGLRTPVRFPMRHSKGQPICAIGRLYAWEEQFANTEASEWDLVLGETFGDLSAAKVSTRPFPLIRSCFLEGFLKSTLLEKLESGRRLQSALQELVTDVQVRTIHWQPLDILFDESMRIAQVITSLQRGGAERIAIDLHRQLRHHRVSSMLVGLGPPSREAFPIPKGARDLSQTGTNHSDRIARCAWEIEMFAPDLIHAHLLKNHDLQQLASLNVPTVATIHNMRDGWPDALDDLSTKDASLLVACSKVVERDLKNGNVAIPCRTIWNGIDVQTFSTSRAESSSTSMELLDIHNDSEKGKELVLVAIANPRPQKRLERLPAIAASLQSRLVSHGSRIRVRLLIAGQASQWSPAARESNRLLEKAIAESGLEDQIELLGPVSNVRELLSSADILVSAAAFEGLSLAHLEALACNVPVVATDVGGTCEIAARCPGLSLVPVEAAPENFAETLLQVASSTRKPLNDAIRRDFSVTTMTLAYSRFYQRLISAQSRSKGNGVLFIMNNLSTGGAQSSARRLLMELHAHKVPVRVAILEEHGEHPTLGRQALIEAGIPVMALEPAGTMDPLFALQPLFQSIDRDPPTTIVFWNAISEYKLLVADNVWGIPIVDVSPGEMYYSSMDRYFQKPRPGLPYMNFRDYGDRLTSVVVKYHAEQSLAVERLGTKVHVVPNGVPLHSQIDLTLDKPELLIGTAARISHQKKLEELIEAIRLAAPRMPPFRLQIVGGVERGSEEYASRLRALSQGLPIDWIGEQADPSGALRSWDVFVLISEPAGCPNAGLEAMSHGLPLVATDVGGASEQVVDGSNGRLVARGDIQGLSDAIIELASSPELRVKYGQASHQRAADCFSMENMVSEYRKIFGV